MAELPRYKRPSSLITSGDVQSANISALVQAQQMQTQALTKGIDTIIQFALAKSERDLKTAKINAIHGMNSIMPNVHDAIEEIRFNIETNEKFTHEDFAASVKQLYGYVKPVYKTNGEVGTQMYTEIQNLISPLSSEFTKKQIDKVKALTKSQVETTSNGYIKDIEASFNDSNLTDLELLNKIAFNKDKFHTYASIELANDAESFKNKYDEDVEANLMTLFSNKANSSTFAQTYTDLKKRLDNNDFGNRTELFKSLPPDQQAGIKKQIFTDYFDEVNNIQKAEARSLQEDSFRFYGLLRQFHKVSNKGARDDLKDKMGLIALNGNKEMNDILNKLDTEEKTSEKNIEYILIIDDMIKNPESYNQEKVFELYRAEEITSEHVAKILEKREQIKNKDYKEAVSKIKLSTGISDGEISISFLETESQKKAEKLLQLLTNFDDEIERQLKENPNAILNYDSIADEIIGEPKPKEKNMNITPPLSLKEEPTKE